jgi:pimeloyl-ACP methyl ester carboxylesterase
MILLFILIGGIVTGIVVIAAFYVRDIGVARKRLMKLGSRVIETSSGPIECAIAGAGSPVLVVHGAIGGFDQGLFLAKNVDMTHHQVICVSRFGYLRTPLPSGATLDSQADAYASLLDALGIQQVSVFAISAGTTSALRFAARHPDRVSALILLSPDAPGETYMSLPPRFVFDKLMRSDFFFWIMVTFFWKKLQTTMSLVPKGHIPTPEDMELVKNVLTGNLPVSPRMDGTVFETYTCWDDLFASVTPASTYPLTQIQTPTLFINAANDPISIPANVRAMAEQMPNGRLYIVPDGGHLLFGHTEDVKAEIGSFLRDHEPGSQKASAD